MKKLYFHIITLLVVVVIAASCNKGGDGSPSDSNDDNNSVFLHDVQYTLKVRCGGSASKAAYSEVDESGVVVPVFSADDVAKPLVMTVAGKNVSGRLTLTDVDGTFAGTLQVPVDVADSLVVTGTIENPAAGGDADDRSTVSLDDLVKKCGHQYTAKFSLSTTEPIALADSKSYFHFKMSPLQHWLLINNDRYAMSDDGELWMAADNSPVVTSFYKMAYNAMENGKLYDIDYSGFVDMGITNVLWADKNVGADGCEDAGEYFEWDDVLTCVTAPLEVPKRGKTGIEDNDFHILCSSTTYFWGRYKGVKGMCFFVPGYTDAEKDPFLFFPAGGSKKNTVVSAGELGMYWTSTKYDNSVSFRFFFNKERVLTDSRISKWSGDMSVRPILRCDAEVGNPEEEEEKPQELRPFFPEDYSWDDVVAWYTCRDEEVWEDWALYLFKDNTYVLTQYLAKTDARIIQNVGSFVIDGAADDGYNNFDIIADIWHVKKNVHFENGECTFQKRNFKKDLHDMPVVGKCTRDNSGTSILYFPSEIHKTKRDVVAWYKQIDARDDMEDFLALYVYGDDKFCLVSCWIKDGVQSGKILMEGNIQSAVIGGIDFCNMNIDLCVEGFGYTYIQQMTVVDGVCTISGYNQQWKIQDNGLLWELLGLK